MATVNLTQAAKLAGVSRVTLHAHIKNGKLSAVIGADGTRQIDTAEIMRVYGTLASDSVKGIVNHEQLTVNPLQAENDALRAELRAKDELLAERGELVQALKAQIHLIEHKPDAPDQQSWLVRLLLHKIW